MNILLGKEADVYHRFYLTFVSNYIEAFGFGLRDPKINFIELFMNHVVILKKFCEYFQQASFELIDQLEHNKVIFDHFDDEASHFKNFDVLAPSHSYAEFLKHIRLKKYRIKGKLGQCSLTKREFECLFWTAKNIKCKTDQPNIELIGSNNRTLFNEC